jgi:hypothetical protein
VYVTVDIRFHEFYLIGSSFQTNLQLILRNPLSKSPVSSKTWRRRGRRRESNFWKLKWKGLDKAEGVSSFLDDDFKDELSPSNKIEPDPSFSFDDES